MGVIMYSINSDFKNKGVALNINLSGFPMGGSKKVFKINGTDIREIKISSTYLASPLATEKVLKKYRELINYLTELFLDDDDTDGAMREALNQIEKFRLEIKNKYRDFLKKKELEMMAKQLSVLQKEAKERLEEIRNSYMEEINEKRSK